MLAVIRGLAYRGYVTTIFGIWLFGFYLLITSGAANKAFTPDALAWYVLVLVVPVALLAVPSIVHRNSPFIIAFVAIVVLGDLPPLEQRIDRHDDATCHQNAVVGDREFRNVGEHHPDPITRLESALRETFCESTTRAGQVRVTERYVVEPNRQSRGIG